MKDRQTYKLDLNFIIVEIGHKILRLLRDNSKKQFDLLNGLQSFTKTKKKTITPGHNKNPIIMHKYIQHTK